MFILHTTIYPSSMKLIQSRPPEKMVAYNLWNTFVSCILLLPLLVFSFMVSLPMSAFYQIIDATSSTAIGISCAFFFIFTLPCGLIMFVVRLASPAWKYKLRYNFFATANLTLCLMALLWGNMQNYGPVIIGLVMGGIQLFDIYLVKQRGAQRLHT